MLVYFIKMGNFSSVKNRGQSLDRSKRRFFALSRTDKDLTQIAQKNEGHSTEDGKHREEAIDREGQKHSADGPQSSCTTSQKDRQARERPGWQGRGATLWAGVLMAASIPKSTLAVHITGSARILRTWFRKMGIKWRGQLGRVFCVTSLVFILKTVESQEKSLSRQ